MKITIVLILAALTATAIGQTSDRCKLLDALKKYGLDDTKVANLMCVAHHATNFNKNYRVKDDFHGIFQFSAHGWCECPKYKSRNLCGMKCSVFHDENPKDDIECALTVVKTKGFADWNVWKQHCANKDLKGYLTCPDSC